MSNVLNIAKYLWASGSRRVVPGDDVVPETANPSA